jgi:phosphomannomutase
MSIGGLTSVDVTETGTDKGTRLAKLVSALVLTTDATMFVGDALFPGGNDY